MPCDKMHPWFRGIDWENIHKYPAPYHPELKNPGDTRHFDDDIPAEVRYLLRYPLTPPLFPIALGPRERSTGGRDSRPSTA